MGCLLKQQYDYLVFKNDGTIFYEELVFGRRVFIMWRRRCDYMTTARLIFICTDPLAAPRETWTRRIRTQEKNLLC